MGEATKVFFTHRVSGSPDDNPMEKWYDCIRDTLHNCSGVDVSLKKKKKKAGKRLINKFYNGIVLLDDEAECMHGLH